MQFKFDHVPNSYREITDKFGEALITVEDMDYQGDTRILLKGHDGKFGYLLFGWGSCSGCDALQACTTLSDVEELAQILYSQIKWFESKNAVRFFFLTHDWEGDFTFNRAEQKQFISRVIKWTKQ